MAPTNEDPDEEQDIVELTSELTRRVGLQRIYDDIEDQWARADMRVEELTKKIEQAITERDTLKDQLNRLDTPASTEEIENEIKSLEVNNARAREVKQYRAIEKDIADTEAKITKCKARMDLAQIEQDEAIEATSLPIPGLGIVEDGITLNGVPFSQCSAAQRLKASMAIAMRANPTVRVILIRDGSLLDAENMRVIEEMASENDFQLWIECVGSDDGTGVYIEDGTIRN